jgi:hypothetical protein
VTLIPDLEVLPPVIPRGARDIGDGYVLLHARNNVCRHISASEEVAFAAYLKDSHGIDVNANWSPTLTHWARLHLTNGQVARSAWKKKLKPLHKVWMARNIKVCVFFGHPSIQLICYRLNYNQAQRHDSQKFYFTSEL